MLNIQLKECINTLKYYQSTIKNKNAILQI